MNSLWESITDSSYVKAVRDNEWTQGAWTYARSTLDNWWATKPERIDPVSVIFRLAMLSLMPENDVKLWFTKRSVTHNSGGPTQRVLRRLWGHSYDHCSYLVDPIRGAAQILRPCDTTKEGRRMRDIFEAAIDGLERLKKTYQKSEWKEPTVREMICAAFDSYIAIIKKSLEPDAELYTEEHSENTEYFRHSDLWTRNALKAMHLDFMNAKENMKEGEPELLKGEIGAINEKLAAHDRLLEKRLSEQD